MTENATAARENTSTAELHEMIENLDGDALLAMFAYENAEASRSVAALMLATLGGTEADPVHLLTISSYGLVASRVADAYGDALDELARLRNKPAEQTATT